MNIDFSVDGPYVPNDRDYNAYITLRAIMAKGYMRPIDDQLSMDISVYCLNERSISLSDVIASVYGGLIGIIFNHSSQVIGVHIRLTQSDKEGLYICLRSDVNMLTESL